MTLEPVTEGNGVSAEDELYHPVSVWHGKQAENL